MNIIRSKDNKDKLGEASVVLVDNLIVDDSSSIHDRAGADIEINVDTLIVTNGAGDLLDALKDRNDP